MAECVATTKSGTRCTAQIMSGSQYCYRHNPHITKAVKAEASAIGGRKRQIIPNIDPVKMRTVDDVVTLIENNTYAVRSGNIDPKTANAIVQNINVLLKVYELAIVDTRVRKLEKAAGIDSPNELIALGG